MIDFGTRLTVLIGPGVPTPASPGFIESIAEIEVKHSDKAGTPSGFKIVLRVGRAGLFGLFDYDILKDPRVGVLSRVILVALYGFQPTVIMDGLILEQQLDPGEGGEGTLLTLLGKDVSAAMDFEVKKKEHPALPRVATVAAIMAQYAQYGIIPLPTPSPTDTPRLPTEGTAVQSDTDLDYIVKLANEVGYTFFIEHTPVPGVNQGYWGPEKRLGLPQKALSVNMGPDSNVKKIKFSNDAEKPKTVEGKVSDRETGVTVPIKSPPVQPGMPLAAKPAALTQPKVKTADLKEGTGVTIARAMGLAMAQSKIGMEAVTAEGELDTQKYGGALVARALVGVRGVGFSFDGLYYVKSVTHKIKPGSYTQKFELAREGTGATVPVLPNL